MSRIVMTLIPKVSQIQVLVTKGSTELMRAKLPSANLINYERAVPQLVIGLAQCLDEKIHIVVCAAAPVSLSYLGFTDGLGRGLNSVFYEVQVVEPISRCDDILRGVGDFRYAHRIRRMAMAMEARK